MSEIRPANTRSASASRFDPEAVDVAMLLRLVTSSAGVEIRDRYTLLRVHRSCFVGRELVDLFADRLSLSREQGERLGQRLLAQGHIHSVRGERGFEDKSHLYAVGAPGGRAPATRTGIGEEEFARLAGEMVGPDGIALRRHRRLLVDYPACFSGREVVDWIVARTGLARTDALRVGQALMGRNALRHVFDEIGFVDADEYYVFA